MDRIVDVKCLWCWVSLWSGPEYLAMRVYMIFWERGNQVADIVIKLRNESILSDLDAILEVATLSNINQVLDLFQLVFNARGGGVRAQLLDKVFFVLEECLGIRSSVSKERVEVV